MSNLTTDIEALKEQTLKNLQNSKSRNTVRAYKSDFEDFGLFCVKNGFKSLPSEAQIVSLYLTHLSTKEVKLSTIKRRLVSIGVIHYTNKGSSPKRGKAFFIPPPVSSTSDSSE